MDSLLLDIEEAAASLRVRRSLLYKLIAKHDLIPVKVSRRTLIPRAELARYVRRLQEAQEASRSPPYAS